MYQFGPFVLPASEVFFANALVFAIVNTRPIVPGHVLVLPRRVLPRMAQLDANELAALWAAAQMIGTRLEKHHDASATTFAVQDGRDAGQTVPHTHVHVLPRRACDFEPNDKVYDALDTTSMMRVDADSNRVDRSAEEMGVEALELRSLFPESLRIE